MKAQRAASASRLLGRRAPVGGLGPLESLAATSGTELLCVGAAANFAQCCQGSGADWDNVRDMDHLLVGFFNAQFLEGASVEDGPKLMASLAHFTPELHKVATEKLPRASRCLVAWRRRAPPRARLPLSTSRRAAGGRPCA